MGSAVSLLFRVARDSLSDFGELIVTNLLWVLLSLPVVTAPPALAGLFYATHQLARHERVTWRTFFEGFRASFWVSWRWALLNIAVAVSVAANFLFYGQHGGRLALYVQSFFLGLGFLWLLGQYLVFPLLYAQSDRRLRTALRNSAVLYLKRPGFTLSLVSLSALLGVLAARYLWAVWLIIGGSFLAYLANRGTLELLAELVPPASPDADPS